MQNRPQDNVKVAVYTEQMSAPQTSNIHDLIRTMCVGLGLLISFWLHISL